MSDISETTTQRTARPLTRAGIAVRLAVSIVALALLLGGTFFGSDSDFPFGPFRMYSTRNAPDGTVNSLRLEAVDANHQRIEVSAGAVGLRRAELEGSLPRMKSEPKLMKLIVVRYEKNNPDKPKLIELDVIVRTTQLKNGLETDSYTDKVVAKWTRP